MKKFSFFLCVAIFATLLTTSCKKEVPDVPTIEINGVKWAKCNLDAPGTFATEPENAGMFYQWNRKIGWSATEPLKSSNGGTVWDASMPDTIGWTAANDPCPDGWRVPTIEELEKLLDESKIKVENVWLTQNNVSGRKFTDKTNGNFIFLPAAGQRKFDTGALTSGSVAGFYWSSTQINEGFVRYVSFFNNTIGLNGSTQRNLGFSVRCVMK